MLAEAAFALGAAIGLLLALAVNGRWRRTLVTLGFPLSVLAGGAAVPAWGWLLALAPPMLAYPLRAWRDAPFFPTPLQALDGLDKLISLAPEAQVLDAGCGIGHGLAALRRVWPGARCHGVEWSRPLAWLAARRCRWARVTRADMWGSRWCSFELVYLFLKGCLRR